MEKKQKTKYDIAKEKAMQVIMKYPKSNSGNHFLTMKNGKRLFFGIFVKKYGLDGKQSKYGNHDIYRRIKVIECFEFFLQKYHIAKEDKESILIETLFFRFVIKKYNFRKGGMRYELLSFYDI